MDQPRIHIIQDMDIQPKFKEQSFSPVFADGRSARPPIPGTVARPLHAGDDDRFLQRDDHYYRGFRMAARPATRPAAEFFDGFPNQVRVDEALLKRVRIDIAGIGKTAGTEELASLAEKTGGHFRKALSLEEAYAAVRWQRPSFSSPDGLAVHQLLGEVLSMREELASLERSFGDKSIDNPEYSERKKEMAKRIKALTPQINAVRDRLSREIAGLIAERQVPLISMTSLKAAFERGQIGRKIYLERTSDAAKTLAEVNRRIEAKQHLLDSLPSI